MAKVNRYDRRLPTPSAEWVEEGDTCVSLAGEIGLVLKVRHFGRGLPSAQVKWDYNDYIGWNTISTLRKGKP